MVTRIEERTAEIREQIDKAAKISGRKTEEIKLMGVSKFHPFEAMKEAAPFVDLLGENRVQEAAAKRELWKKSPFETPWHLIGQLQKNKAKRAIETFDLIESVDSFELATVLNRICSEKERVFPILLEVNMSHESSKSGSSEDEMPKLLDNILENCPCLSVLGLMTIAPITENEKYIRKAFSGLRELKDRLSLQSGLKLPELSMGMSADFEYAIAEGSTTVRIGTAIFGERDYTGTACAK